MIKIIDINLHIVGIPTLQVHLLQFETFDLGVVMNLTLSISSFNFSHFKLTRKSCVWYIQFEVCEQCSYVHIRGVNKIYS